MRDLKIRPGMDTPKAKLKNPTPKDADSLLKQHMDKRQREKEPESRDPVRYATDRVEKTMRRGAAGAADASRRMIKHYRGKLRQSKENVVGGHSAADMGIGAESDSTNAPMEYAFSPVQTAARNEVGKPDHFSAKLRRSQKCKCRPAGAWAAESYTGRESRLSAEPCRKKNNRTPFYVSTVRPRRYNGPSAQKQFGRIAQGWSCPKERTGHDHGHAHHACSTN